MAHSHPHPARRGRRGAVALGWGVAVAVLGLTVGALLLTTSDAKEVDTSTPDTRRAERTDFDVTVHATGELKARDELKVRNIIQGRSTMILEIVNEGEFVEEGDIIARLESAKIEEAIEEQENQVETAKNEVVKAEANLSIKKSELEGKLRDAELKLEAAEIDLQKWREGELPKKRRELELDIEKAKRRLTQAKEKVEEAKKLFERGFLAKNELDSDEISLLEAEAGLEIAKINSNVFENYERLKTEQERVSAVDSARDNIERVTQQNTVEFNQLDTGRAFAAQNLRARELRLEVLREQLTQTVVRAPRAGLVVLGTTGGNRWGRGDPLKVGDEVKENTLLVTLPNTDSMLAEVKIHESWAGKLTPGQPVAIRVDAIRDRTFTGRVETVGVLAESGGWRDPNRREYPVRIAIDIPEDAPLLKPTMGCSAEIVLDRAEDVLAVPAQAVHYVKGDAHVYVPAGSGKWTKRSVEVDRRSATHAEILAGLEPGETVLLRDPAPGELTAPSPGPPGSTAPGEPDGAVQPSATATAGAAG